MPLHWSPKPWPSEAIAAGLLSRRELPLANVWGREPDRISVCEQSSPDLDLLRPHLEPVTLDLRHSIETANEPIRHVYFAESGFVSVVAKDGADRDTEVGIVGREGVTGMAVVLGDDRSPNDSLVQAAGSGPAPAIAAYAIRESSKAERSERDGKENKARHWFHRSPYMGIAGRRAPKGWSETIAPPAPLVVVSRR
jgi:CRP-like cAMP-binding protein